MKNLRNQVQLITYADSMGKDLKELDIVLREVLDEDLFGGVHILPFFPSSHDRGFTPLTQLVVEKSFGNWHDISKIGARYDLLVDLVLNHISSESLEFKDYLEKGDESKYKDYFLPLSKLVKSASDEELIKKIYRPRPSDPFRTFTFGDGSTKKIWCTFSEHHIDLDWNEKAVLNLMKSFLLKFVENKCKIVRLDAVGYIFKKLGTNGFFVDEVYDIIDWMKEIVKDYNCSLLTEVHFTPKKQIELSKRVDMTYDFALPMLCLHALFFGESKYLYEWERIRPQNVITTLDTHDGIGIVDVKDLLPDEEIEKTMEKVYEVSKGCKQATGESSENLDIYQLNSTFYSAIGEDDEAYIISRAIQFFFSGIPQVYYVGLLCGKNDLQRLERTNVGRDINRHNYTIDEIKEVKENSVLAKRLFKLIKLRNSHPAFQQEGAICQVPQEKKDDMFEMKWTTDSCSVSLQVDLRNKKFEIISSRKKENEDVIETIKI